MTDYNSMKADEYAQRQGDIDGFYHDVERIELMIRDEIPQWAWDESAFDCERIVHREAKRRVMQAIKERGEP